MDNQGQYWPTDQDHLVSGVGAWRYYSYQPSLQEDDIDSHGTSAAGYEHADSYATASWATESSTASTHDGSASTGTEMAWSTPSLTNTTGTSIESVQPMPVPVQPQPQLQQAPGPAVLYCEIPECPWSFNIKDEWINHIIQDHYGDNCPPQCSCLICNKEFDASRTSGGDRRANFVRRLEHIRKHILKGNAGEGRYDDYEMRDHPVRLTHDDTFRPRFHPANYRSPKQKNQYDADNRMPVNQATEDHRRRKEADKKDKKERKDKDKKDKDKKDRNDKKRH